VVYLAQEDAMATRMDIEIDDEIRALIRPLSAEERDRLEASILEHGCLAPLVVWSMPEPESHKCYAREVGKEEDEECDIQVGDGVWDCRTCEYGVAPLCDILLDGHNRYEICKGHDVEFETVDMDFETRDEAVLFVIDLQLGRRNLEPFAMIELALKRQKQIAAIAKANQGTRTDLRPTLDEGPEPIDTLSELAKIAGVSRSTMAKGKVVDKEATEEVKQQLRAGEKSINSAYGELRPKPSSEADLAAEPTIPISDGIARDEEPEDFGERWTSMWERMLIFFCSVPRRGGIVNLVRTWSSSRRERTVAQLRKIAETCGQYADELEAGYSDG
jgi:hypothetical protein